MFIKKICFHLNPFFHYESPKVASARLRGWDHCCRARRYGEIGQAAPACLGPPAWVAQVEAESQRLGEHQATVGAPLVLHSHQLAHVVLCEWEEDRMLIVMKPA